jgi:hypothetical protein
MSFQAYIDNIEAKTGLKPADFRQRAAAEGFFVGDAIAPGIKATRITDWLKAEFGPEQIQEKWKPVFRQDLRLTKEPRAFSR